ncbi:hypothetical protein LZ575_02930 [Antarcticibacterium sp. 1MA-6-2]|uniref:hypothetical protein n=1 Tax=Antarcticibacterium sp. 1MA-6-2 TaxID=2908210 RepID=UPI001F2C222B|nr:hypothetical protein [Antarcticibacterium sp. 1MA-6-2]UJH91659.1 hypothetical protein LZ575_02930 [Antarcticibacterium sp. 1MA-6-2]
MQHLAPDWVLLTGKFLGLSLVIVTWIVILMGGGILMQLILGADNLEISLYLKTLFGLQLIDYLLFTAIAFVVHIVVNQKYIGFMVVLLVFNFMAFPTKFGIEHSMLVYGDGPGWWYTDMRGFGASLGPWLWFKAYWIAWAILLAVAAKLLWVRGKDRSLKSRFQIAQQRFTGSIIWISILGAGLLFTLGSFIFYNTNMLNDYQTESELTERQAEYERRYGRYRNTPKPQVTATKLQVELYPERQQAEIHGTYTLVNKDSVAIDSIHIGSASGSEFTEVKFDRSLTA